MASAPRVLVVGQHFWPEGFRINDICDYFVEQGVQVEVLCGLPNYPKGEFFPGYSLRGPYKQEHGGIQIRRVPEIKRGSNSNLRIFLNYMSFPVMSLLHLPRLLFRRFDRIFIYQLSPVMMAWTGIVLGWLTRTTTVMYVLDLWPENLFSVLHVKTPWLRKFATGVSHWHYRRVDRIVVLSELMRDRLAEVTGKAKDEIEVVPQACEKFYEETVVSAELQESLGGKFTAVFTGNISPAQSFVTIIDAAEQLEAEGLDIRWLIVGDGMSRSDVEDQVRARGLEHVFRFEGHHPATEMPKYFGSASVLVGCLVQSDLLEATIPAKVLSYIAGGRPLVLAMDGDVKKLVEDEAKCGFVGPAGDSAAFAANLRTVYNLSETERRSMGERGRKYHFEHLERNKVLARLTDFIMRG
ncbi:glycosyltransferase WbuB [Sinomonas cellulolyticus]|uniref:Glycosyltransferase family 4 protein n=1 Tax=Sinomonas cellulolyticus TaxID=2801916 RepID=A0ABS1K4Z9_9MICC|nr:MULTISPECIES: glycosyltransferase family 4 protein [Sinomonas]MBL0706600.1 glycosyltransferase family 4 protein [Sinomonas cellulolyticus]GHG45536.1 glycosyltransferase WbuB [Sinomonas sp. KCTC 49339]